LLLLLSAGVRMSKSALYSTRPRSFFGARPRSTIALFAGRFGSSSPKNRPVIRTYGPTSPNDLPSANGPLDVISIRVTPAWALAIKASIATTRMRMGTLLADSLIGDRPQLKMKWGQTPFLR
jgi:hypothetical protein